MGNKKLNQAEQIMKKYRDGVNRIELRYKKIDKNNKNLEKKIKELDEKIEYKKSFIEKLESEGHQANLELINKAKARLESAVNEKGELVAQHNTTSIFIYPGYKFKIVDAIITNFHLPKSTLIMLVSAFIGRDETIRMYEEAVKEKYHFFSFGDATFLY